MIRATNPGLGVTTGSAQVYLLTLQGHGAPVDGIAGTGAGLSVKGSGYTDLDTGFLYINLGTLASPEWHGALLT